MADPFIVQPALGTYYLLKSATCATTVALIAMIARAIISSADQGPTPQRPRVPTS